MTLVMINFGLYVEYQVVWNDVEIMLTKVYHVCINVPRVMAILVHLSLLWKQLGTTSVTKFFGHDNVGNWLGVEYQHWSLWNPTSNDQMRIFRYISKDLWISSLWPLCCLVPKNLPWMSFRRAYSTCHATLDPTLNKLVSDKRKAPSLIASSTVKKKRTSKKLLIQVRTPSPPEHNVILHSDHHYLCMILDQSTATSGHYRFCQCFINW
jgi:hypothetical protein